MLTILRAAGFRFFFYAIDRNEPPHVHVDGRGGIAKFWLDPVTFDRSRNLKPHDVKAARDLVVRGWI